MAESTRLTGDSMGPAVSRTSPPASANGRFIAPWGKSEKVSKGRRGPLPQRVTKLRRRGRGSGGDWWAPLVEGDVFAASQAGHRLLKLTIPFVGFALYTWVAITFQFGLAQPAVLIGLVGLLTVAPLRLPRFVTFLTVWIVWSATGLLTTQHPDVVGTEIEVLVKVGLIVFLGVNALRSRAQIRAFMILVCLGYGMYPARGTIINFARGYTLEGRALWNYVYENPNDLAAISVIALAIAGALYITERKGIVRLGAIATIMVLPVMVALTQSRGGFLGLLVFSLIALWGRVRLRLPRFRTTLAAAAVVVVAAYVVPEEAWSRLGQLSSVVGQVRGLGDSDVTSNLDALQDKGSAAQRFQVWGVALQIAGDHVVTGIGQGAYAAVHGEYDRAGGPGFGAKDAHSTYLSVLAETGIVGLFLFMGMLATVLLESERARKRMVRAMPRHAHQLRILQAGLVGFLAAGIFGSYSRVSFLYLLMILIWVCTFQGKKDLEAMHARKVASAVRRPAARPDGPRPVSVTT
ncbi:MAG: hypothetical protein HKN73_13980 [Gemmatimonadetes bacterium]|nr:hypothetical protein [Gemmatimonadota bacterium]